MRVASISVNNTSATNYRYDQDDLLIQAGGLFFNRDPANGSILGTSFQDISENYERSLFGEIIQYRATTGGTQLYSENYTRDAVGRITNRTESIEGNTTSWSYLYDPAGRLHEVRKNGSLFESYEYDANGNRLSVTSLSDRTTASIDHQDRLERYGETQFSYDTDGALETKVEQDGVTVYDYNAFGQLVGLTLPGGRQVTYSFDALNNRAAKIVDGSVEKKWLYGEGLYPVAEFDGQDNLLAVFHGAFMVREGKTYRILRDHLGSVRLVVDASTGEIAQSLSYDPWGKVIEDTNPGFQPLGFAGGLYDPDTGLVQFGARDYDASLGRFLTQDPIRLSGGLNLYSYVGNDPVNFVDPFGLDPVLVSVYGINSLAQAQVFTAGLGFFTTVGIAGTIAIPDATDLAITAAVAKLARARGGIRQVQAGASTWHEIGKKAPHDSERRVAQFLADEGNDVYLIGKQVGGPDIRVNGRWWEIKSVTNKAKTLGSAVDSHLRGAAKKSRNRVIIDARDRCGVTTGDVIREIARITRNRPTVRTIDEIMVIGTNGSMTINPWRF